jgi:hypothetical protein
MQRLCLMALLLFGTTDLSAQWKDNCGDPIATLHQLIVTHPKKEMRLLDSLIAHKKVALSFDALVDMQDAGFTSEVVNGTRMIEFAVNLKWLCDHATSELGKQIVLWHEYQHFKDMLSGAAPLEAMGIEHTSVGESQAHLMFEGEVKAYTMECQFATQVHYKGAITPFCKPYAAGGSKALRLAVAQQYGSAVPFDMPYKVQLIKWAGQPASRDLPTSIAYVKKSK